MLRRLFKVLEPASDPRICRMIFDELCVLANGDIVCSCGDPAGRRVYGNVGTDRIGEVFDGPGYRDMRSWQLGARASSWCPAIETECGGRVSRPLPDDVASGRRVRTLQLEPISHCNLSCPSCPVTHFGTDPLYRPDRVAVLPLEVMLDVVEQLPDLEKILFYNFGEPFLHPQALDFLRAVRARRPDVLLHTSTNGLAFTADKIEALASEALLDRIVFSIDGALEESYRRYRIGGELGRALDSLRDLGAACERHGTRDRVEIVWQYILFRWNDGDAELCEARKRAECLGVPLRFVITHTREASQRYRPGRPELRDKLGVEDPWSVLTCDLRRADLDAHGGIAAGRYLARVRSSPQRVQAPPGGRFALRVELENRSTCSWNGDRANHRLGVRLLDAGGRTLTELPGVPLDAPPLAAKTSGAVIFDHVAPELPGDYRLLIDVVESGVAWFHERGSAPAMVHLRVLAGSKPAWSPDTLVEDCFRSMLGRTPEPFEAASTTEAVESGRRIEALLRDISESLEPARRIDALERGRRAASVALGLQPARPD